MKHCIENNLFQLNLLFKRICINKSNFDSIKALDNPSQYHVHLIFGLKTN